MARPVPVLRSLLAAGAILGAQAPDPQAPAPAGVPPMKEPTAIRTPELLKRMKQKVTVEGFFYDGSIPMLVNDFVRIRENGLLVPDTYIPLVGRKLHFKWGDRLKVTGRLEPGAGELSTESAVLRVGASDQVVLLQASPLK